MDPNPYSDYRLGRGRFSLVALRDVYSVDHELGVLVRKDSGLVVRGTSGGSRSRSRYIRTPFGMRSVARVIYALVHGVEPGPNHVRHRDGNWQNNRPDNLYLTGFAGAALDSSPPDA